jgi:hypothetical protein
MMPVRLANTLQIKLLIIHRTLVFARFDMGCNVGVGNQ